VAVNYSVSESDALRAVGEIEAAGGRAMAVAADVAQWSAAVSLVAATEHSLGPIDILVNNAGITHYIPLPDLDAVDREDWQRIFDVNVGGAFACARAAGPLMRARGHGRILNVASNSALTGDGSSIPYVASKAAVIGLTRALARALAPHVLVNAIAPGWMETRWLERYIPAERREGLFSGGVAPVAVDDVAAAAVSLIANDAITGETLVIDRGERLHL
jgi:3-oxoacyl-[acyl-carrier protein] reductase